MGRSRKAANRADTKGSLQDQVANQPAFEHGAYVVDTRPLCQGMPFVLTDAAHPRIVLKHGSHFMVMDQSAGVPACNTLGYGYYWYDTRHLSQWEISLDDVPLSLLSADVARGYAGTFLYTNPQTGSLLQQKVTVKRQVVLSDILLERLTLENFSGAPLTVALTMKFQSDFADMFEVRGLNRPERGRRMIPSPDSTGRRLFLAYEGLDGSLLETIVEFSGPTPHLLHDGAAGFQINLPVRTPRDLDLAIYTRMQERVPSVHSVGFTVENALASADRAYVDWRSGGATVTSEHEIFNLVVERAFRDIYVLRQPTPKGWGLAAGIPWYCAVFGRDSAITSLQMLPYAPHLARESIAILAAYQGSSKDTFRAERPGKIMHELRLGELARMRQIPHTPYFGTVDATQLWLILLARYVSWTADLEFAAEMWPHVKLALDWLDSACKGGYITYIRESSQGLENQGWKDSGDSVPHTNGVLARPPIALCEAQGYLYAAWTEIADLARLLGHTVVSRRLYERARGLKARFLRDFWMEDEQYLAMALDGDGNQVKVISSNPGHCIWTGLVDGLHAQAVAARLMQPDMNCGWGLRTLSAKTQVYNPLSYHNGSIWPHDNAIIAEGFRKIGRIEGVHEIMESMIAVAQTQPDFRLPELYCGFERQELSRPVDYPVACSPQSWAAGALFQMLQSCINFQADACNKRLAIINPMLPQWVGEVTIRRLRVGDAELDLSFTPEDGQTFCHILRKSGDIRVVIES